MNKGIRTTGMLGRGIVIVLLTALSNLSLGQIWSEDFGTAALCSDIDTAAGATTANGTWSTTFPTSNNSAVETNAWYISSRESYMGVGNCGDGCSGSGNSNRTLHISTPSVPGAVFENDSLTDVIVWTPAINTVGANQMKLRFDYLLGGGAPDSGTVVVGIGGTSSPIFLLAPAKTLTSGCGVNGEWTTAEVFLPNSYNNQLQFHVGFRWQSNGDAAGTQPSFAIDNIVLTDTVPVPDFVMSADEVCSGDGVDFTNLSQGLNNTYSWNFGSSANPSTSTATDPSNVVFNTAGTYVITLTATNVNGNDVHLDTITVYDCVPPISSFASSDTVICEGNCIDFFDTSIPGTFGIGAWNWQFQGGSPSTSNVQNPATICYTTTGSYNVTLTTTDTFTMLTHDTIYTLFIEVDTCSVPTATFTSNVTEVCNNGDVEFYAFTTGNPDFITWIFDGGNPATVTDSTHLVDTIEVFYSTSGVYDVTIIVTNEAGTATDTVFDYIEVLDCPVPIPAFDANDKVICPGTSVVFQDNSQYATEWFWQFPGGQPASSNDQNPVEIKYTTPGVYPVILIVKNVNGEDTLIIDDFITVDSCLPPDPRFSIERDSICRNTCVRFYNKSLRTDSLYWIFWYHPYPDSISGTASDTIRPSTPGYAWMLDDTLFNDTFFVIWKDYFPVMARVTNEDDPIFCFDDSGTVGLQMFAYNEYDVAVLNMQDVGVLNVGGNFPKVKAGPDKEVLIDNIESRFFLEDTVSFEGEGTAPYFKWFPEDGLSCYDCPRPIIHPTFTRKYYLTNYDDYGCQAYDSVIVYVDKSYHFGIPNIFSPNGDDENDILWVRGNNISREGFVMKIWNRYGELVFESFNQNNGWDGTYKGVPAPAGSYKYYVKATFENGQVGELKGNVTLLRY
jgi:gliding motility-associated-like protein